MTTEDSRDRAAEQLLSLLLDVRERVAGMSVEIKRVSTHLDSNTAQADGVRAAVAEIRTRPEDHTGRITLHDTKLQELDQKMQGHSGTFSRLKGIWIGIGLVITTLASVAALAISLFKK